MSHSMVKLVNTSESINCLVDVGSIIGPNNDRICNSCILVPSRVPVKPNRYFTCGILLIILVKLILSA